MVNSDENNAEVLREEWAKFFGDTPPFGWKLRRLQIPWLRYHALPDSKRYADDDVERAEILARGNNVGDRLLGTGSLCWCVEARVDDEVGHRDSTVQFYEIDDGEEITWRFRVRPVEWRTGAFDAELGAIAEDELEALWVRRSDGVVLAPYDGGFDLFPISFDDVETLKAERTNWLSPHPSGL